MASVMTQRTADVPQASWKARWASIQIREALATTYNAKPESFEPTLPIGPTQPEITQPAITKNLLPEVPATFPPPKKGLTDTLESSMRVGIVGAGCAGLFTAMIFDHLNGMLRKPLDGLEMKYDIWEAASEKRLGGRLYTHDFLEGDSHCYYDVGAMRFPEIDTMARTFELFKNLGMEKYEDKANKSTTPPQKGDLIEYIYEGTNCPWNFNGIQYFGKPPTERNPFKITGVPKDLIIQNPGVLLENAIKRFIDEIRRDPKEGWEYLEKFDRYSVRQFLAAEDPGSERYPRREAYDYNTIEWLETFGSGTRWFDQALSEEVLEAIDFDPKKKWYCIEGGTQEVAARMRNKLHKREIYFNSPVTAITKDKAKHDPIFITANGKTRPYTAVFNSAPLGAMQRMDLSTLKLNYETKQAIRSLNYGASCKVGVLFDKLWWMSDSSMNIRGGIGRTDLPLRVCVYPSYNVDDPKEEKGVLLCSYTWSQDAQRMGSLISRDSPEKEELLKELLIRNLALLHSKTDDNKDYNRVFKLINDSYITHHAWDWYQDPHMAGAFAYFGPGQFRHMYPDLTKNSGDHIIIGEAASTHHAWIVGALESAVRGVYEFLFGNSRGETKVAKYCRAALALYDKDKVPLNLFTRLPAEWTPPSEILQVIPRDGKVVDGKVAKKTPNSGELLRQQVVAERSRDDLKGE